MSEQEDFEDPIFEIYEAREKRKQELGEKLASAGFLIFTGLAIYSSFRLNYYLYEKVNLNSALEYGFGFIAFVQFAILCLILEQASKIKRFQKEGKQ